MSLPTTATAARSLTPDQAHAVLPEVVTDLALARHENARLKHKLEDLLRRLHGPSSEKIDDAQMLLKIDAVLQDQAQAEAVQPPPPAEQPARPRSGGGRRRPPADAPVERVHIETKPEDKVCKVTGVELVKIREEITRELDYRPSQFLWKEYVREVFAHPQKLHAPVIPAALPARPIPGADLSCNLLAHLLAQRFVWHLPYYRQEQIAADQGVQLERQKIGRWIERAVLLLQTPYDQLKARVLGSRYIQADETPVDLLDPQRPNAVRQAWLWLYHAPESDAVVFEFKLSRGQDSPLGFIPADWRGVLQTDGYAGYNRLVREHKGVVHAGCFAHLRRKWCEAQPAEGPPPPIVIEALALIGALYRIERNARDEQLSAEQRGALRASQSAPLLPKLHEVHKRATADHLPASRIGIAANYALNRWPELCRFAEPGHGFMEIDNNPVENAVRPTALGKKNWLFVGHPDAGDRPAVIYSLTATCKLLGISPEGYFRWVLPKLAAGTNHSIGSVTPHQFLAEAARSQAVA